MAKEFTSAQDVQHIAEKLIEILKPDLEGFEIRYIRANEDPKKDGMDCVALARKVVGLNAYLAGSPDGFFVMEVGPRFDHLSVDQKIAVVHHELCHFGITDEGGLTLIPHEIQEFVEVVRVHGEYEPILTSLHHALQHASETSREEIKQRILNS
jgi:hypothetical protein